MGYSLHACTVVDKCRQVNTVGIAISTEKSTGASARAVLGRGVRILVTGGCGFIGSNFVRYVLHHYNPASVSNVDVLTYAGNPANLAGVAEQYAERYEFFKADVANVEE